MSREVLIAEDAEALRAEEQKITREIKKAWQSGDLERSKELHEKKNLLKQHQQQQQQQHSKIDRDDSDKKNIVSLLGVSDQDEIDNTSDYNKSAGGGGSGGAGRDDDDSAIGSGIGIGSGDGDGNEDNDNDNDSNNLHIYSINNNNNNNNNDEIQSIKEKNESNNNNNLVIKPKMRTHRIEVSEEKHNQLGEMIKSIIYGGLDGIMTTFAIVSAVHGANLRTDVILVIGFANLVADAFAMGIGDYLSESAEFDFARSERKREQWEFDNFQEGEILEMVEIYQKKGIEKKDAELILRTMAKYPKFFIDHMLIEELDIQPVEEGESAIKNGFVTMFSFLCFGCIPLLSYVATNPIHFSGYNPSFIISIALTICTLLLLGAIKGKMTESSIWKSALFVMLNGVAAGGASYFIGLGLSQMVSVES